MKVIYYADDGTEFETEEECLEYETLQNANTKKLLSEIHAFDMFNSKIIVGDGLKEYSIEDMINHALYVTFDSDEALEFFNEQQEYYGYNPIHECTSSKKGDVYIYKDDGNGWESAMEMVEHYQAIIDRFTTERK